MAYIHITSPSIFFTPQHELNYFLTIESPELCEILLMFSSVIATFILKQTTLFAILSLGTSYLKILFWKVIYEHVAS